MMGKSRPDVLLVFRAFTNTRRARSLADYEAAGTAVIEVTCGDDTDEDADTCAGGCSAAEVTARFVSIGPVPATNS